MTDKAMVMQSETDSRATIIERVVVTGDLSKLTPQERVSYYRAVCESTGLNPLTRPFDYITLNGRLVLYARKDATDQLRKIHGVSIEPPQINYTDDLVLVTVIARDGEGRTDSELGAVSLAGLKGADKANAIMKAITKAKRRVTLSIVGLGWLDETEIETIADAKPVAVNTETGEIEQGTSAPQATQPSPPDAQTAPDAPHWSRFAAERDAFAAWREQASLSDTDCKKLLARYKGLPEVKFFRDIPGTRVEIQNMIEAQIAREAATNKPETEVRDERLPF